MDYWAIENTWGTQWGVNGLGKISMNDEKLLFDSYVLAADPQIDLF